MKGLPQLTSINFVYIFYYFLKSKNDAFIILTMKAPNAKLVIAVDNANLQSAALLLKYNECIGL